MKIIMGWLTKLGNFIVAAAFGYEVADNRQNEVQIVSVTIKPSEIITTPTLGHSEIAEFGILTFILISIIAIIVLLVCKDRSVKTARNTGRLNV